MQRRPITARALVLACIGLAVLAPAAGARATAAGSDPGALAGAWKRVVTQADIDRTASFREEPEGWEAPLTGPYTLVLASGSFSVRDKAGFAVGQTTRVDSGGTFDVLAYIDPGAGAFCPQWIPQNASYTWAVQGSKLVLTPVDDRCADRNSILAGQWTRGSNVRTLVARETSSKQGKKSMTFSDNLTEGGTPVGSDTGICKAVSDTALSCRITLRLNDGTLVLRGNLDRSKPVSKLKVVSGSGAYRGAKGSVTAKSQGAKKTLLTLTLA